MTYYEMIDSIAAKRDGKRVEYQWIDKANGGWKWHAMGPNDAFNFGICRYRIAPEPLTAWVNVYESGRTIHRTEDEARSSAAHYAKRIAVKCVEVTE